MINHPRRSKSAISATPAALKTKRALGATLKRLKHPRHDHDADWAALMAAVKLTFNSLRDQPLFQTDADLWPIYMRSLEPTGEYEVHKCHACRSFMQHFGGLACIDDKGVLVPAMWRPAMVPSFYVPTVNMLSHAVSRAKVIGPFLSSEIQWGQPRTGQAREF